MSKLDELKNKIFEKKQRAGLLTNLISMCKEMSCLGDLLGRTFKVYDGEGKLVYTVEQEKMTLIQIFTTLNELRRLEELREAETKKKMPKKGRRK